MIYIGYFELPIIEAEFMIQCTSLNLTSLKKDYIPTKGKGAVPSRAFRASFISPFLCTDDVSSPRPFICNLLSSCGITRIHWYY